MVLTDRQRKDLHSGIYDYLKSRPGDAFQAVAEALALADPDVLSNQRSANKNVGSTSSLLEKKWTAIPRLQKKVLELERAVAQNARIHAHRTGASSENGGAANGTANGSGMRRMLPRLPCSHEMQGHSAVVTCVQVHPVFTVVVSGSEDGSIKIWDHESGEYMKSLKGHTNTVNSLSFTPSGAYLASASNDLSIKIWDFSTHACVRTLRGHDHTISSVRFIPAQGLMSSNGDAASSTTSFDIAAAGAKQLLSASRDQTVKMWDMESGFCDHTFTEHNDWVRCLAVRNHDGGIWASSGNDQVIYVYDSNTRAKVCELRGHEHVIESVSFLCEEAFPKATASNPYGNNKKHIETARDYLVSGGRDRTVKLWSVLNVSCLATFTAHENWVKSVVLHPSGNYIVTAGDDRTIRVFDIKANRCLRTLEGAHTHFITSLDMHHTLPVLVSGGVDQLVKSWVLD